MWVVNVDCLFKARLEALLEAAGIGSKLTGARTAAGGQVGAQAGVASDKQLTDPEVINGNSWHMLLSYDSLDVVETERSKKKK